MHDGTLMRIKDLEEKSGMPRTTIHFYLRQSILHPPSKTGRTMAYYDESHLKRLQDIQEIKANIRMPLALLREKIAVLDQEGYGGPIKVATDKRDVARTTKAKDSRRHSIVEAAVKSSRRKVTIGQECRTSLIPLASLRERSTYTSETSGTCLWK